MTLRPEDVFPLGARLPPFALIDVRSPVEVARGALPFARALPLMSDEERHQVGLRYRDAGQEAAIELGYELAGPHLPERTRAWREATAAGPSAVTCWRGGLRSALAVEMIGRPDALAVRGGYKGLRGHLASNLGVALERKQLVVIAGLTGSGKTEVVRELLGVDPSLQVLDLEGEARHRGSAFGAHDTAQPSQATFENALAAALVLDPAGMVVVEDESRFVGARTLPAPLFEAMTSAPVVILEVPLARRAERIFAEYVGAPTHRLGVGATRSRLEDALGRLRSRLGGARTKALIAALHDAEATWDDPVAHRGWIVPLLEGHYDRLYDRSMTAQPRRVLARGDAETIIAALLAMAR